MPWQVITVCQELASSNKMFNGFIFFSVRLETILSLLSTLLFPQFALASSWLKMSSFRVSFGWTRDDIRLLVLGRIGFAVPLSCSFRFSWIPLLSANKSSLSATLVSMLFLNESPHRQVLSISLKKRNLTPTSSIVFTHSTKIAFSSLIVSFLHAASIHQLVYLAM